MGVHASRRQRVAVIAGGLFLLQTAYLAASASPSLFYVTQVFVHVFGGALLGLPLFVWVSLRLGPWRAWSQGVARWAAAALVLGLGGWLSGLALAWFGNLRPQRWLLMAHIALSLAAVASALAALVAGRRASGGPARACRRALNTIGGLALAALAVATGLAAPQAWGPDARQRILNPLRPPWTMAGEAMHGASGPFFPSAAATTSGGTIPSDFFMESDTCGRSGCHPDIYAQWEASAHHFSSFNNQWYRKSIEYMQQVVGVQPSKWCGGCHDHAVLFNGTMDEPLERYLERPEAHTGLGCVSCHAIVEVKDTMGNGGFVLEYPPLHDLATSEQPLIRAVHDLAVHLDPGPHRQVFLKPFHREQQAEFCSACHKVHLDAPVNHYRWIRGFNEYDNWQASGVSGQGARSFYYPPQPKVCGDCHMPRVPSADKGQRGGYVHDHSFYAANTAVPLSRSRWEHLERTIEFLQSGAVTLDLFAASPARPRESPLPEAAGEEFPELASTFAVGEEAATPVGRRAAVLAEAPPLWAPLERTEIALRRGEEVRVDVVVRTRDVGHFFPGGTVDAFDVWVELRASDETGRVVYWSGPVHEGGEGPVDPGAHFYRSLLVDGHGNPIDKRNAWASRAVVYVRLIPPGAADVVRFRLRVPEDCGERLALEARLNYRKFSYANTVFSFAGTVAPGEPERPGPGVERVTPHWDDRKFVVGEVPENVSADRREIPRLPIVVLDRRVLTVPVVDRETPREPPRTVLAAEDWQRWNDYGIGLLLQGDLRAAEESFRRVIEVAPDNPEGYVNVARARLQEGDLQGARAMLEAALARAAGLAKAHFFLGVAFKELGEYGQALGHLRRAAEQYPRDRVVRNTIGRVLFLQRRFEEAIAEFERVLEVDPEDLMAHYNLMLCYRGLGRTEEAEIERRLYERFKADEDAQMLTGPYLRAHPLDNRERQPIHEHPGAPPEIVLREASALRERGERHAVLPGEARAYVARLRAEATAAPGAGEDRP